MGIESVAKAAADELKVAVREALDTQAELEAQQKALDDAKAAEQALIDDESVSNTKKMKAKIKLAGLESKYPLPLDRAKINQGAAVRKVKRAQKKADKAAEAAAQEREIASVPQKKREPLPPLQLLHVN